MHNHLLDGPVRTVICMSMRHVPINTGDVPINTGATILYALGEPAAFPASRVPSPGSNPDMGCLSTSDSCYGALGLDRKILHFARENEMLLTETTFCAADVLGDHRLFHRCDIRSRDNSDREIPLLQTCVLQ